jgi:chromosome segregation ATPase
MNVSLQELFKKYDKNNSGVLVTDLGLLLKDCGIRATTEQRDALFMLMVKDDSGRVSASEFSLWWTRMQLLCGTSIDKATAILKIIHYIATLVWDEESTNGWLERDRFDVVYQKFYDRYHKAWKIYMKGQSMIPPEQAAAKFNISTYGTWHVSQFADKLPLEKMTQMEWMINRVKVPHKNSIMLQPLRKRYVDEEEEAEKEAEMQRKEETIINLLESVQKLELENTNLKEQRKSYEKVVQQITTELSDARKELDLMRKRSGSTEFQQKELQKQCAELEREIQTKEKALEDHQKELSRLSIKTMSNKDIIASLEKQLKESNALIGQLRKSNIWIQMQNVKQAELEKLKGKFDKKVEDLKKNHLVELSKVSNESEQKYQEDTDKLKQVFEEEKNNIENELRDRLLGLQEKYDRLQDRYNSLKKDMQEQSVNSQRIQEQLRENIEYLEDQRTKMKEGVDRLEKEHLHDLNTLNNKLSAALDENNNLQDRIESMEDAIELLESNKHHLEKLIDQKEDAFKEQQQLYQETLDKLEELQSQLENSTEQSKADLEAAASAQEQALSNLKDTIDKHWEDKMGKELERLRSHLQANTDTDKLQLIEEAKKLRNELEENLNQVIDRLNETIREKDTQIHAKEDELNRLLGQITELKNELDLGKRLNNLAEQEKQELLQQITNAASDRDDLLRQLEELRKQYDALMYEYQMSLQTIEDLKRELQSLKQQAEDDKKQTDEIVDELTQKLQATNRRNEELDAEAHILQSNIQQLQENADRTNTDYKQEIDRLTKQNEDLESVQHGLKDYIQKLTSDIADLERKIKQKKDKNQDLTNELRSKSNEYIQAQEQIKQLQETIDNLNREKDAIIAKVRSDLRDAEIDKEEALIVLKANTEKEWEEKLLKEIDQLNLKMKENFDGEVTKLTNDLNEHAEQRKFASETELQQKHATEMDELLNKIVLMQSERDGLQSQLLGVELERDSLHKQLDQSSSVIDELTKTLEDSHGELGKQLAQVHDELNEKDREIDEAKQKMKNMDILIDSLISESQVEKDNFTKNIQKLNSEWEQKLQNHLNDQYDQVMSQVEQERDQLEQQVKSKTDKERNITEQLNKVELDQVHQTIQKLKQENEEKDNRIEQLTKNSIQEVEPGYNESLEQKEKDIQQLKLDFEDEKKQLDTQYQIQLDHYRNELNRFRQLAEKDLEIISLTKNKEFDNESSRLLNSYIDNLKTLQDENEDLKRKIAEQDMVISTMALKQKAQEQILEEQSQSISYPVFEQITYPTSYQAVNNVPLSIAQAPSVTKEVRKREHVPSEHAISRRIYDHSGYDLAFNTHLAYYSTFEGTPTIVCFAGTPTLTDIHTFQKFTLEDYTWEKTYIQSNQFPQVHTLSPHRSVYNAKHHSIVIVSDAYTLRTGSEVWEYSLQNNTWKALPPLPFTPDHFFSCTYRSMANTMIVVAGNFGQDVPQYILFEYSFVNKEWQEVRVDPSVSDVPEASRGIAVVYRENDDTVFLIGGELWDNSQGIWKRADDAVWSFSFGSRRWERYETTGTMPIQIAAHGATLIYDRYIAVYGGARHKVGSNRQWKTMQNKYCYVLDLYNGTWKKISLKEDHIGPRTRPNMFFREEDGLLYIVGGNTTADGSVSNDIHCVELAIAPNESLVETPVKPPRLSTASPIYSFPSTPRSRSPQLSRTPTSSQASSPSKRSRLDELSLKTFSSPGDISRSKARPIRNLEVNSPRIGSSRVEKDIQEYSRARNKRESANSPLVTLDVTIANQTPLRVSLSETPKRYL